MPYSLKKIQYEKFSAWKVIYGRNEVEQMYQTKSLKVSKQQRCAYTGGAIEIHHAGEVMYCLNEDNISVLNLQTGETLDDFESGEDPFQCFALSRNGKYLAASCKSTLIKIFNTETKEITREFKGHSQPASAMIFDPSSALLATASTDKTVRVTSFQFLT